MVEKGFVDALIKTIEELGGYAVRPSDNFTLGIPDVLGWIVDLEQPRPWSIAIEAKQLNPLMENPFHKGRRTGLMLKHEFTGPQISMLRKLQRVGVDAMGLVRVSADTALRIDPCDIPAKTGNFTYEELVKVGRIVSRVTGSWRFWENANDQVPGAGHRDHPRV